VNLERNDKVKELEVQIKGLKIELAKREVNEKSRVKDFLVDNCKGREEEAEDEECDCENPCLCDNENDCMTAGGYWYNDQCNECLEEDTSTGEFNCPIPAGAKHIVTDTGDYWEIEGKTVGLYQRWYDIEKTKKRDFTCRDAEGYIVRQKGWYEDGALRLDCTFPDGKNPGENKWWYNDGTLEMEFNYNYKDGKLRGIIKKWYKDGTLKEESNLDENRQKDGVCRGWFKSGKLKYECNFKEGKCVDCVHGVCRLCE
jgi:hypothetical protein